jgi:hypothetical protein
MPTLCKVLYAASLAFLVGSTSTSNAGCRAYIDENLTGDRIDVAHNETDLRLHKRLVFDNWDKEISSIEVFSGICRVFTDYEFKTSEYRDLRKGVYLNMAQIHLLDNSISSIEVRDARNRRLKPARRAVQR